jgi:VWFA-related protein
LSVALDKLEKENFGLYPNRDDDARLAKISDENFALSVASATKEAHGDVASLAGFEQQSRMLMELLAMARKTAALTSVMESMSGVEGKKIMVMALDRFGLALGESMSGNFPVDTRVDRLRKAVMRTANANGITLYPIHPAGLRWINFNDPQLQRPDVMKVNSDADLMRAGIDHSMLMNQTASFLEIAQQTGGLTAAGANDIAKLLPQVAEDLESYYSLAYRATSDANGERKVAVTTKNRDYQVRSRRAVVNQSDDAQMDDRVVSNLFQTLNDSVIPIELKLGAVKQKRKNRWAIPLTVRIPISGLTQLQRDGAARGTFSVFVGTGGDFGVISEVSRRTQHYSITEKDLANARSSFFTYSATVEVDRFADAISVAVRDDVSKELGLARVAIPGRGPGEKRGGDD